MRDMWVAVKKTVQIDVYTGILQHSDACNNICYLILAPQETPVNTVSLNENRCEIAFTVLNTFYQVLVFPVAIHIMLLKYSCGFLL